MLRYGYFVILLMRRFPRIRVLWISLPRRKWALFLSMRVRDMWLRS